MQMTENTLANDHPAKAVFRHARRAPDKVALHYLGRRISYGEFAYWIALARDSLARQELRPGSIVALVSVSDIFDGWVLRFALQTLGLTTVDLANPDELRACSFQNVSGVITTIHGQPIGARDVEYKLIRISEPIFSGREAGPVPEMSTMDGPVGGHILLTSGTTGHRKKVLRDAEGTSGEAKHRYAVYGISEDSVFHALDFAAWSAAGYLLPIWTWSAGATAVCHRGDGLQRSFELGRITHAIATPQKLEQLLAAPRGELRFHPELHLFATAAPLTAALASAVKSRLTPNVFQLLGSTEGKTVGLTRINGPDDLNAHVLVSGSGVQIVDDGDKPLPARRVGAIRVRPNDGVKGYLDDEEASRQFFRDGYFYPGDLGEIRSDGRLVLHGRTTSTINLGGEKRPVEIIEQLLQDSLSLDGICLISVEDELHILIQSRRPIGKNQIMKAFTRITGVESLPGAHFQYVDSIPRNEMGKIDRPAIRQRISAMRAGVTSGLLQTIFHHAQRAPDKVALHYLGQCISYGEFAYWLSLARDFLAGHDLRAGSIAALAGVPDVFDGWVLRFALQSLGLTTVDLANPGEFGAYRFKNVGCVITTIREPIEVPDAEYKLIRIPDPIFFGREAGRVPESPPLNVPAGGHILLTSGTTGYRKKILRDSAGVSREVKRRCDLFSISESSVVHALDFAPWTAAGYLLPIIAWGAGATVVCHRGKDLQRSFETERITQALATPVKLQELLATSCGELRFHAEMRLIVGGAPLTAELARAAKSQLTPNVFHFLTSTEGGPLALTRIEGPEDLESHVLFPDADVQIVDGASQPLPPGNVGVVRVRPVEGLTGYLDDDDASRQFFRDGYFYPGDLGEIRPDGRLVLHGRTTSTINLGGEKRPVELLEQRLQDSLGLDGICLVSVRTSSLHDELHILIQSQRPIGRDQIIKALVRVANLASAPEAHLQFVDSIPRNEMGKIDRPAIRQKISALLAGQPAI